MSEPGNQDVRETFGGVDTYEVRQNEYKLVNILPTDRDTTVIRTKSRLGCDAVLAWRQDPAGGDHVLMTHFDPRHINDHLQVLRDSFPQGEGEIRTVLLMAGGSTADRNKIITDYLEKATGTPPDVVVAGDNLSLEDIKRSRFEDPLSYQLSFTRGYNGKPEVRRIIVPLEKPQDINQAGGYLYEKVFDVSQPTT